MNSFSYKLLVLIILLSSSCNLKKEAADDFLPVYKGEWTSPPLKTPTNKVPDGAVCGNGDIGMVLGGTPEKQIFYFSKNDFWRAQNGYPNGGVCYVGQLQVSSSTMDGASYHVEQRIADATINGSFTKADGSSYQLQAWCAATQNIAVVELKAGDVPVHFELKFMMEKSMDALVSDGCKETVNWHVRKFEGPTLEWPTAVAVGMRTLEKEDVSELSLAKGEKATIVLSFCTNHEQEAYIDRSVELLKSLEQEDITPLFDTHKKWWSSFWNESQVELGDPVLEKYYYGSQYLLACCSRNTAFPPGLWGTSLTMDATANGWAGDYHLNYNHMAPWWGIYSSNHIGLAEPYDTPILEYMDKGRSHAKEFLGKKGVYYPVGIGPKGFCSSMFPLTSEEMMEQYNTPETGLEGGYMFLGQKSDAAFCTANMFMRFYHTYDREYAEKVYPFIREVANFWEDYLVYENGRYVSYNDNFWEVGPWEGKDFKKGYGDINPTVSLGLCRMLFSGIIEMSRFLQTDADKKEKWEHILNNLSEIPTVDINGATRIKACEGGIGSGSRTAPGFGRVMMHGLVFPSGVCGTVTNPAFAKILLDEVYRWGTDTTKYTGWKDSGWENLGNGFETYFTSAARLGYDGTSLLTELKSRISKTALPNFWIAQGGGGIETLSAVPSCINEMLLQGYEGVIRVFPVWPKDKNASFKNLRSHGAFLVSGELNDGEVNSLTIFSEQGRDLTLQNPWGQKKIMIKGEPAGERIVKGNYVKMKTEAGLTYQFLLAE